MNVDQEQRSTPSRMDEQSNGTGQGSSILEGNCSPAAPKETYDDPFDNPLVNRAALLFIFVLFVSATGAVTTAIVRWANKSKTTSVHTDPVVWTVEDRQAEIRDYLVELDVSDPTLFLEETSPQSRALNWLIYEDTSISGVNDPRLLQRYALILLAFATNFDLWQTAFPWPEFPDLSECSYVGIDCDSVTNSNYPKVVSIDMLSRKMTGTIPDEIGLLTDLTSLTLAMNRLEGSIPETVFLELSNLVFLDLAMTDLSSTLSPSITHLTRLQDLYLSDTPLSGSLPVASLQALTNLRRLAMRSTHLVGPILDAIVEMPDLVSFDGSSQTFTGTIPSEIVQLTALQHMVLVGTGLSDWKLPVPGFGQLTNLEHIDFEFSPSQGNNLVTVAAPVAIPTEIGLLTKLTLLQWIGPSTDGTIPTELGLLTDLAQVRITGRQLQGSIPSELQTLTRMTTLFLYDNNLQGTVPPELGNLSANLTFFRIHHNPLLSGKIPVELCASHALVSYDCDRVHCGCCSLTECIPA